MVGGHSKITLSRGRGGGVSGSITIDNDQGGRGSSIHNVMFYCSKEESEREKEREKERKKERKKEREKERKKEKVRIK